MRINLKIALSIFLALAVSRFIPHPPNFTSLIALSFYVPAIFGSKYMPVVLLSFVFTDLKISESTLKKIHKNICNETFNSISVDGEQSPSDSSILVATGKNLIKSPKLLKIFEKSLQKIFTELSEKLLLDGEGATKLIEIEVSGLKSKIACKEVAKKIANSPLLKTAAYGEDPNCCLLYTSDAADE